MSPPAPAAASGSGSRPLAEPAELAAQAPRKEQILATARAYLAVASFGAIYLDPTEPTRYAGLAYGLLVFYVAYGVLLAVATRTMERMPAWTGLAAHAVDLAWATAVSMFTEGPNSPFFLFFVFVLLASAYRWGSQATLATAGVGVALFSVQALAVAGPAALRARLAIEGEFELNRFLMRSVYLVIMAYLLGYLGDAERRPHQEAAVIAATLRRIAVERSLRRAFQALFGSLLEAFGGRALLLALREVETGRSFLWRISRGDPPPQPHVSELEAGKLGAFLFPFPADAWSAARGGGLPRTRLALDGQGARLRHAPDTPPEGMADVPFERLLAASYDVGEEWMGRLFILDPARDRTGEADLRFLRQILRETAPAIHNVDLLRRLRSRAGAVERARVARELHDGVIQSLIGLEMQVDALRQRAVEKADGSAGGLIHIQALLRNEVLALRELMSQMKPLEVAPGELLDHLAGIVERFRNETGIAARLASDLSEVSLPPRLCRELARIVQEALVNVRKHSGARNVVVRLDRDGDAWTLVVDDDGRGFPFEGRLGHAELEAGRKGPVVIKERVRACRGELTVESQPGRGSRLEIRFPGRLHG